MMSAAHAYASGWRMSLPADGNVRSHCASRVPADTRRHCVSIRTRENASAGLAGEFREMNSASWGIQAQRIEREKGTSKAFRLRLTDSRSLIAHQEVIVRQNGMSSDEYCAACTIITVINAEQVS